MVYLVPTLEGHIAAFWPEIILRTRAARASRSGHEALAMEVLHSIQTGSWGMLRSRNWCSGAHGCNEGRDV